MRRGDTDIKTYSIILSKHDRGQTRMDAESRYNNYRIITSTRKGLRLAAQRLMELDIFPQFALAKEMISPFDVS